MIKMNISNLEEESINFLNLLTENKRKELRNQMVKFLKESHWPDSLDYALILEFIDDFFLENSYKAEG